VMRRSVREITVNKSLMGLIESDKILKDLNVVLSGLLRFSKVGSDQNNSINASFNFIFPIAGGNIIPVLK
jgi:hypothetical protein